MSMCIDEGGLGTYFYECVCVYVLRVYGCPVQPSFSRPPPYAEVGDSEGGLRRGVVALREVCGEGRIN